MNFITKLKTMLMIVAILIITYLFSLFNPTQVPVDFYFYETAPMSIGIFGVLASFFGAFVMLLVFIFDIAKVNLKERKLRKEIKKLKKQLEAYEPETEIEEQSSLPEKYNDSMENDDIDDDEISD